MADNEWVRLTAKTPEATSMVFYALDPVAVTHSLAPHRIRVNWTDKATFGARQDNVWLTDAELDALAVHAPAVKALVEAVVALEAALAALDGKEEDDARQ